MAKKVTVYTSTGCGYCATLKQWLQQRNIAFDEKNVTDNPAFMDELTSQGIFGTPVTKIDDEFVIGWRPNKMTEVLGL